MNQKLKPLLKKALSELIEKSDAEVWRVRHEINHALNVLEWLYKIEPKPTANLELAALFHDCDRFFSSRAMQKKFNNYSEYKKEHSKISAQIAEKILNTLGQSSLSKKTKELILAHETGGFAKADILRDCDSLAFFDKNVFAYIKENAWLATEKKIKYMYNRMSPKSKKILRESNLDFQYLPKIKALFRSLDRK